MNIFLDWFFLIFHTAWTVFNLTGWIFRKTRRWNLYTLLITAFSWLVLGIWYGWGYCACTDWHWKILRESGEHNLPRSYITYLVERIFQMDAPDEAIEKWTGWVFATLFLLSILLNVRDARRKKKSLKK